METQEESTRENQQTPSRSNWGAVKTFIVENKIDSLLWITRICTVMNVIWYLIPLISPFSSYSCYKRALICNAAVSALRLHQRLPNFRFTREYLGQLLLEDSCHYLVYSLMFLYSAYPLTPALIPLGMFALLHTSSFSKKLLDVLGTAGVFGMALVSWIRKGVEKLQGNQIALLRFIASTEIMLMPLTVVLVISGVAGLLLPFIYYKFLTFRYASRRNPYSRMLFGEFRLVFQHLAMHERCPHFIRNIIFSFIRFISNMAPSVPTATNTGTTN